MSLHPECFVHVLNKHVPGTASGDIGVKNEANQHHHVGHVHVWRGLCDYFRRCVWKCIWIFEHGIWTHFLLVTTSRRPEQARSETYMRAIGTMIKMSYKEKKERKIIKKADSQCERGKIKQPTKIHGHENYI